MKEFRVPLPVIEVLIEELLHFVLEIRDFSETG